MKCICRYRTTIMPAIIEFYDCSMPLRIRKSHEMPVRFIWSEQLTVRCSNYHAANDLMRLRTFTYVVRAFSQRIFNILSVSLALASAYLYVLEDWHFHFFAMFAYNFAYEMLSSALSSFICVIKVFNLCRLFIKLRMMTSKAHTHPQITRNNTTHNNNNNNTRRTSSYICWTQSVTEWVCRLDTNLVHDTIRASLTGCLTNSLCDTFCVCDASHFSIDAIRRGGMPSRLDDFRPKAFAT